MSFRFLFSLLFLIKFISLSLHAEECTSLIEKNISPHGHLSGMTNLKADMLYTNNLKNREFGKEAPQIFCPARAAVLTDTAQVRDEKSGAKPTQLKTDSSGCLCIIKSLLASARRGRISKKVIQEDQFELVWKLIDEDYISPLHDIPKLIDPSLQSAVTYDLNGGRVGDSLISYFHAKWIALEYGLPFLYRPFPDSERFCLIDNDQHLSEFFPFQHKMTIFKKEDVKKALPSTLITIPYFPDCQFEYKTFSIEFAYFPLQWDDPKFNRVVRECLGSIDRISVRDRPKDCFCIAVHVRRGGTWDKYDWISPILPLKFPPDSYYIEQIQQVARLWPDQPLYVYIFTDDLNPEGLARSFDNAIQNPRIRFDWNPNGQCSDKFEDFYTMAQFDCLIRSASNFSLMAEQLGDFDLVISPTHCYFDQGRIVIDEVEMQFQGRAVDP